MSQLTHVQRSIPTIGSSARRRLAAVLLAAMCLVAVVLVLTLPGESDRSPSAVPAASAPVAPGTRYDGGPDEGTRGAPLRSVATPGTRFDGGPDEGTRGVGR